MGNENVEFDYGDLEEVEDEEVEEVEDTQEVAAHKPTKTCGPLTSALVNTIGRFCISYLPFLVRECKFNGRHWRWNRICLCGYGTLVPELDWHGGINDMSTGHELQPCAHCFKQMSPAHHQWALTQEEELIVDSWRTYREQVLDDFEGQAPYKYELSVKLNGSAETFLLSRNEGVQHLSTTKGIMSEVPRLIKKGSDKPN